MNRILAITTIALFLWIVPGILMLFAAEFSKAPSNRERTQLQLATDWSRFPPADRAECLRSTGASGAYTDLLTCLEKKRYARQTLQGITDARYGRTNRTDAVRDSDLPQRLTP
jgi:hypothetical protein